MSRINPEGQLTRAERLVTVIAVLGAVIIHVVALFGWGRFYRWAQEEKKKERLMVVRRMRDIAPPRDVIPEPPRERSGQAGTEGRRGGGEKASPPPPPDPKVREQGPEPPQETELSPTMEQELQEQPPDQSKAPEHGENSVSVVTDLAAASFIVGGPVDYRGSGTIWVRKGAPPGTYTITFNPVAGYTTPPVQTKDLVAKGQIVFVGKYRRSTELVVESNRPGAQFTIYRPDGRPLELNRLGRALIDDLPAGNYTAVFKDVPGYITPPAISRTLAPGGKLSFFGEYQEAAAGGGGAGDDAQWQGRGAGARGAGAGAGDGYGRGSGGGSGGGGKAAVKVASSPKDAGLDRRVQMVVTSYPTTSIERYFDPISYPEVIIRKSNFQQGWCQVYLVLSVSDRGDILRVSIERPSAESRSQYEALINTVESAVRSWDYDRVAAEVHVDVRFFVE